jgi:CheY-like chemotaxis protein
MIYAGQESAVLEPVDLSELVRDMTDLLKVVVSKHAILKTNLGRDLPTVQVNPAQLRQVIMNLVTNASEALGKQEGIIVICTARAAATADGLRGDTTSCVEVEISDTGCGISLKNQAKIFDPFFTTKSTGHGLGLAVVHRIVRGLGGAIHVESAPGCGSKFRILLPSAGKAVLQTGQVRSSLVQEEVNCVGVVLVVEDEAALRTAVTKFLRRNAFSVLEAADGTAAMNLMREHASRIGLILLDITLPGAPSHEVLAEARRLRSEIRVILTSAYGSNKLPDYFPGTEIDAFIRKPYQLGELVTLVRSLLRSHPTSN